MSANSNLPQYFYNPNYAEQEYYQELLNRLLTNWFSATSGLLLPRLTNAEVTTLISLTPAVDPGRIWFNTDLGKAQLLVAAGTVETITST